MEVLIRHIRTAFVAVAFVGWVLWPWQARAALVPSPDGTTVYDIVNNISWLADGNLAASARFGLPVCGGSVAQPCVNASGSMSYQSAAAWVQAMNAANYLGHSNWQLPTNPPFDKGCGKTGPNGNNFGFGCSASAMGALYYSGLSLTAPNTAVPIPNNSVGPFSNLQPYLYWSQTSAGANGYDTFSFATGWEGENVSGHVMYVLPMIPGKIPGSPAATGQALQLSPDGKTVYDPVSNVTWVTNANLAAGNSFGLPRCQNATTPAVCVNTDGAMSWDSANQFVANMNSGSGYLGQKSWQLPPIDPSCSGYNCASNGSPMGELFYNQLGLTKGMAAVMAPDIAVGPLHHIQPYLYWACEAAAIQDPCSSTVPSPNFEWSFSFGNGFEGTDLLQNDLFVTAYFVGQAGKATGPVPVLTDASVANGATYIAGGLVPGSWAQVKGTNLANATHRFTTADLNGNNLPLTMSGASVTVNGQPAALYYVSSNQIDFQVPAGVAGTASVEVFNNGASSNVVTGATAANAPGIWPVIANGTNYAAAVFLDGKFAGDPAINAGVFRNAKPGDQIQLFGTGLAASLPGVWLNSFQQPLNGVMVTLGTVTVPAEGAGLVYPGEFQINFAVPPEFANLPEGNYPLTATVNGVTSPATINSAPPGPLVIPIQH